MLLLGQGPILLSLAKMALLTGFEVVCIGQHAEAVQQLSDNGIKAVELNKLDRGIAAYIDAFSAVVSLFHEHEHETQLLYSALQSHAFYIGALGSRRTQAQRIATIESLGVDRQKLERIHGPVGLNIGAQTPAQISISILAEVIDHLPRNEQQPINVNRPSSAEVVS
jgi:xanthine dehydrogenase accessory factor